MKKIFSIAAIVLCLLLSSCGSKGFAGEAKDGNLVAKVEISITKEDKISSVVLNESSIVIGQEKPENYENELKDLIDSFIELTLDEVIAIDTKADKLPYITTVDMIDGADETSVLIINAVKNAIENAKNSEK